MTIGVENSNPESSSLVRSQRCRSKTKALSEPGFAENGLIHRPVYHWHSAATVSSREETAHIQWRALPVSFSVMFAWRSTAGISVCVRYRVSASVVPPAGFDLEEMTLTQTTSLRLGLIQPMLTAESCFVLICGWLSARFALQTSRMPIGQYSQRRALAQPEVFCSLL